MTGSAGSNEASQTPDCQYRLPRSPIGESETAQQGGVCRAGVVEPAYGAIVSTSPRALSDPAIIDAIAVLGGLSRGHLRHVFEQLTNDQADEVDTTRLLQQQQTDRFCEPVAIDAIDLAQAELTALTTASHDGFETVRLSPLAPLGASQRFGTIDQANVVTTTGFCELVSDPTNALALVTASRRRLHREQEAVTRLGAVQRVVRARQFDAPGALPHFSAIGLVAIGPGQGKRHFEVAEITRQVTTLVHVAEALAPRGTIRIEVSDNSGRRDEADALVESLLPLARTDLVVPRLDTASFQPHLGIQLLIITKDDRLAVGHVRATPIDAALVGRDNERMVAGRLDLDHLLDSTADRHRT